MITFLTLYLIQMDPDRIDENWHRRIGNEPLGQIFFSGYAAHWCRARRLTLMEIYNGPEYKPLLELAMDSLFLQAIKVNSLTIIYELASSKNSLKNSALG